MGLLMATLNTHFARKLAHMYSYASKLTQLYELLHE